MEIIDPPPNLRKFNYKALLLIGIILGTATGIAVPFLLREPEQGLPTGFDITGLSLVSMDNTTETATLQFEFRYVNEFDVKLQITSLLATVMMKNKSSLDFQTLFVVDSNTPVIIESNGLGIVTGKFVVSNSADHALRRMMLGELIKKNDFTFKFEGTVRIAPMEMVGEDFPDYLTMSVVKPARDIFGYEVPTLSSSMFTLIDLITPGIDPAYPSLFQVDCVALYKNPFGFPVTFDAYGLSIYNRTGQKLGDYMFNSSVLGYIAPGANGSFSALFRAVPNQVGWIVSDLLSEISDVIILKNITGIVKIGMVRIEISEPMQVMASDITFTLEIANYYPSGLNLALDIKFINPCGIIFNLTKLFMEMFVSGTIQKVATIDNSDTWTIQPYSELLVTGIIVNAEYDRFVQHVNGLFDLIGYLSANSYNFAGDIPFNSLEVKIIN
jgi:hypothetical protein